MDDYLKQFVDKSLQLQLTKVSVCDHNAQYTHGNAWDDMHISFTWHWPSFVTIEIHTPSHIIRPSIDISLTSFEALTLVDLHSLTLGIMINCDDIDTLDATRVSVNDQLTAFNDEFKESLYALKIRLISTWA